MLLLATYRAMVPCNGTLKVFVVQEFSCKDASLKVTIAIVLAINISYAYHFSPTPMNL